MAFYGRSSRDMGRFCPKSPPGACHTDDWPIVPVDQMCAVSVRNVHIAAAIMAKHLAPPLSPLPHCKSHERPLQRSKPPEPKASVTLHPEIIDRILEHIDVDGWASPTLCGALWWRLGGRGPAKGAFSLWLLFTVATTSDG